ncbi:penicillin-binding protein 2 [Temperatibacter marinus]|uniref:Penicillin-binding protein 2 n=1 Tax=Temperatibacter marinus TaxID=1456591 RepID=A0AA52H936_9PROT|nr:penicillin-binding protein 2 [Temperatibacter marinus]WND02766.1 penicillin-binding protein 2 [Temperatibacter marinus]
MAREGQRYQKYSRRAFLLAGLQGAFMAGLGARLYYLSVIQGKSYKLKADNNRISLRLIAPKRGEILDRYGKKVATNKQDFRVYLVPEQTQNVSRTLQKINRILPLSKNQISRIERTIKRQRNFVPVTIAKGLEWHDFARVNVEIPGLEGVFPDSGMTRDYPYSHLAAHIVGYVGSPRPEDIGKDPLYQLPGFKLGRDGIERRYEDSLRGRAGARRVEVNAVGREIRELDPRQDAEEGHPIQLTLDMELQQFVAEKLGEQAAGAVVMKAESGEILSMASTPSYDPNDFNSGISQENWNAILKDPRKPLLNKALAGKFPPGSTIKMLVALAALEKGLITEETTVRCTGKHTYGDRTYHCWEDKGHGRVNLLQSIAKSCDVYYYELAEKLDIDDLAVVCERFGLGTSYDIGLDGVSKGLVPTKAWKESALGVNWYQGETLNASIGQGAFTATPLELAVMTARLATGKAIFPKLIQDTIGADHLSGTATLDANPLHLELMRNGMHDVMKSGGTAHDFRNPRDTQKIAGKTGTSQVRTISKAERKDGVVKNEDLAWKSRDHALFVGYAPFDNPEYIVSVLVQHGGGGGSVAAPIGREILYKLTETGNFTPEEVAKRLAREKEEGLDG